MKNKHLPYPLWLKLGVASSLITLIFVSPSLSMNLLINPIKFALILLGTIIASFVPGAILGLFIEQLSQNKKVFAFTSA